MKIRVWHKKFQKFLPKSEWFLDFDGKLYYEDMMDNELMPLSEKMYTVSRFTELYDLNGQEIYEGDIVKPFYHHANIVGEEYTVKYTRGKWMLDDWKCITDQFLDNNKFGDVCKVVKIGNIYETKDI